MAQPPADLNGNIFATAQGGGKVSSSYLRQETGPSKASQKLNSTNDDVAPNSGRRRMQSLNLSNNVQFVQGANGKSSAAIAVDEKGSDERSNSLLTREL